MSISKYFPGRHRVPVAPVVSALPSSRHSAPHTPAPARHPHSVRGTPPAQSSCDATHDGHRGAAAAAAGPWKPPVAAGAARHLRPRTLRTRCCALPEQGGDHTDRNGGGNGGGGGGGRREELDPTSLEAAAGALDSLWDLACQREEDGLLGFLPDHVLEQAAQLRHKPESSDSEDGNDERTSKSEPEPEYNFRQQQQRQRQQRPVEARPVTLRDVATHAAGMHGFTFDSYAVRHLVVSPPPTRGSVSRLSCIRTAPDRAVLRYAVAVAGGERAVLTFGLECEERLAPHYRAARVEYVWQLMSVRGEPMDMREEEGEEGVGADQEARGAGGPRGGPHPSLPPEEVLRLQLAALAREDYAGAFAFASPANRAVTGPLERFTELLRNPTYRPLLRHRTAEPLHLGSSRPGQHDAVVRIVSTNAGMPQEVEMVFHWVLSRQRGEEGEGPEEAAEGANCWMTDSVELLSARTL